MRLTATLSPLAPVVLALAALIALASAQTQSLAPSANRPAADNAPPLPAENRPAPPPDNGPTAAAPLTGGLGVEHDPGRAELPLYGARILADQTSERVEVERGGTGLLTVAYQLLILPRDFRGFVVRLVVERRPTAEVADRPSATFTHLLPDRAPGVIHRAQVPLDAPGFYRLRLRLEPVAEGTAAPPRTDASPDVALSEPLVVEAIEVEPRPLPAVVALLPGQLSFATKTPAGARDALAVVTLTLGARVPGQREAIFAVSGTLAWQVHDRWALPVAYRTLARGTAALVAAPATVSAIDRRLYVSATLALPRQAYPLTVTLNATWAPVARRGVPGTWRVTTVLPAPGTIPAPGFTEAVWRSGPPDRGRFLAHPQFTWRLQRKPE